MRKSRKRTYAYPCAWTAYVRRATTMLKDECTYLRGTRVHQTSKVHRNLQHSKLLGNWCACNGRLYILPSHTPSAPTRSQSRPCQRPCKGFSMSPAAVAAPACGLKLAQLSLSPHASQKLRKACTMTAPYVTQAQQHCGAILKTVRQITNSRNLH